MAPSRAPRYNRTMERNEIAETLERHGFLLEMEGANPFQVRAYRNVARELRHMSDFDERLASGTLAELAGFGKVMVDKITRLAAGENPPAISELEAKYPPGFLGLTAVPGLGPKKLKVVWENLGVGSVGELEYACRENRLASLPGFGAKTQDNILRSLEFLRQGSGQVLISEADVQAAKIATKLARQPGIGRVELAGSLRRRCETIDRLVFLVEAESGDTVASAKANLGAESGGAATGLPVEINRTEPGRWGSALLVSTGPADFLAALAAHAGRELASIDGGTEDEVFRRIALPPIAPELRDLSGIVALAAAGRLPALVTPSDIFGIFHLHTVASDGALTIRETILEAIRLGYRAVGISDHSKTAVYARGLDAERVRDQRREIDDLRGEFPGVGIYHGTESDILGDGSLDFDDETLAAFDFVVASVHSRFGMTRDEMTARLVAAVSNRATTILGHPSGRLLLSRRPYEFDVDAVLDAAAAAGTAIEVNASPYRLDLDWRQIPGALRRGIRLAVNPDAHSKGDLANVGYGVSICRKGGATAGDVWNAGSVDEFEARLKGKSGTR